MTNLVGTSQAIASYRNGEPDSYHGEEECTCRYCGYDIPDGEQFCDDNCRKGYKQDN